KLPGRFGILLSMGLLGLALLVPLGVRSVPVGILLYGGLLGAAAGSNTACNGVIWPEYFGVGSVGAIKGVVSTLRNAATAAAAPLGAWLVSTENGFSTTLMAGAGLAGVAACGGLFFLPGPPEEAGATPARSI